MHLIWYSVNGNNYVALCKKGFLLGFSKFTIHSIFIIQVLLIGAHGTVVNFTCDGIKSKDIANFICDAIKSEYIYESNQKKKKKTNK